MATSLAELAAPGGTPQQGPTTTSNTDVNAIPNVTTTTNPTAPKVLQEAPQTHQRLTRNNTTGATPPIERPPPAQRRSPRTHAADTPQPTLFVATPNSHHIPLASPRLISQEAVNLLTNQVWDAPDYIWTPRDILDHSPTERQTSENFHDVDIEHFCAAVIHPDTGETVTQYKKIANDPNNQLRL